MEKTLTNIIRTGFLASALTLASCTSSTQTIDPNAPIRQRLPVPSFMSSNKDIKAYKDSIDMRDISDEERAFVEKYKPYIGKNAPKGEQNALWRRNPRLNYKNYTERDLVFLYNVQSAIR